MEAPLQLVESDYTQQLENTLEYMQERIAELEFAQEDLGWVRLGESFNYEFSRDFLKKIIARSRLYYLKNPLIRRSCSLQADYVFAQGVQIQATNQKINTVIQEFIDDVQNQKEFMAHEAQLELEKTLLIDGNLFLILFTDKIGTGKVQIRSILVDEIVEIICNPDDSSEVWFYKREWTPVDEDGMPQQTKVAYYPDIDYMPTNKFARLPKTRKKAPIYWDAPIIQIKTGSLKKSKFGIPETYPALDWAKAHEKQLMDWATIIATFAMFAFNVKVPGGKQSVAATKNKLGTTVGRGSLAETNPPTAPGSFWVASKDGAQIDAIKTSGATTSAEDARQLRIMVAAAMGLPDPMLSGEVDVGNLATAKTLDRPTELKFRSRQKVWESYIGKIANWVVKWAIEAPKGLLRPDVRVTIDSRGNTVYAPSIDPDTGEPINLHLEVVFPPILERTIQERIDAITGAVTLNGKEFAIDSPQLKKLTIRLMLQALGLNDVDELTELIFAGMSDEDLQNPQPEPGANTNDAQPEPEPNTRPIEIASS